MFFQHCLYRFDEAVQVLHLESVWVQMVEVLKLFQQGLVVYSLACKEGNHEKFYLTTKCFAFVEADEQIFYLF